jgi:hypothetical protein
MKKSSWKEQKLVKKISLIPQAYEVVSELIFEKRLEGLEEMLTAECYKGVCDYIHHLEKSKLEIVRQLENIQSVEISTILVRDKGEKLEKFIVVTYKTEEKGYLVNIDSNQIVHGTDEVTKKFHHWIFESEDDSWKICSFFGKIDPTEIK